MYCPYRHFDLRKVSDELRVEIVEIIENRPKNAPAFSFEEVHVLTPESDSCKPYLMDDEIMKRVEQILNESLEIKVKVNRSIFHFSFGSVQFTLICDGKTIILENEQSFVKNLRGLEISSDSFLFISSLIRKIAVKSPDDLLLSTNLVMNEILEKSK